jgi:hypothetical protein
MPNLSLPAGLGALLVTEEERVDLGEHGGRRLRAHVQQRTLRIALGQRRGLRVQLTRMRPTAVEVSDGASMYELPIEVPPDPWARRWGQLALIWLAAQLLLAARARLGRALAGRRGGDLEGA